MTAIALALILPSGGDLPDQTALKAAFNADKDKVRVVMLVSPT